MVINIKLNREKINKDLESWCKENLVQMQEGEEYKDQHYYNKYICGCGYEFKDYRKNMRRYMNTHKYYQCPRCRDKKTWNLKTVKEYFENNDCKLLTDNFKDLHQKVEYICECGRKSKIKIWDFMNGHRCYECGKEKVRKAISGENHYSYNPNLTRKERYRKNKEYKKWRKKVFERDDYTCQVSGEKGNYLVAHHLESYDENPELRLEVSNGITINQDIHLQFHKEFGFGQNTEEQFEKFKEDYCVY